MSTSLITHPLYAMFKETWRKAQDVYEGAGGFLDPDCPYLIPHPREWLDHSITDAATGVSVPNTNPTIPSPKLKMRRKLASYANIAEAILETVTGALFKQAPTRTFTTPNETITTWWQDVDGKGQDIDAFLQDSWTSAAVFSHTVIIIDKPATTGETQADMGVPKLRRYTPLDVIDWLEDEDGEVIAVKLIEAAPRAEFGTRVDATDYRVREVTQTEWKLYDKGGKQIDGAPHGFSRLPVVFLYGKRRPTIPVIGKSVIGDPDLHIDLYNLQSEIRELLRNQTFGILNVPIGKDGNAELEKGLLGNQSGTANVLFSTNPASYISPDAGNVAVYHEHSDRLTRLIYRLASTPWESDSKDAEAEGSMQLKRQDMQNTLVKYAGELQRADDLLTELAYEAINGEQWEAKMEADGVSIAYPDTFEIPDFKQVADAASAVIGLEAGETATKEIKKRVVFSYLNDLTDEQRQKISTEIDAIKVLTADEKRKEMMAEAGARFGQAAGAEGDGDDPPQPKEPPVVKVEAA